MPTSATSANQYTTFFATPAGVDLLDHRLHLRRIADDQITVHPDGIEMRQIDEELWK